MVETSVDHQRHDTLLADEQIPPGLDPQVAENMIAHLGFGAVEAMHDIAIPEQLSVETIVLLPSDEARRITVDEERELIHIIHGTDKKEAQDAFGTLFTAFRPLIRQNRMFAGLSDHDLDDILSATSEKAWNAIYHNHGLAERKGNASTIAWFRTVAEHILFDNLRAARIRQKDSYDIPNSTEAHEVAAIATSDDTEAQAIARTRLSQLAKTYIETPSPQLTREDREQIVDMLWLTHVEGYSINEIAKMVNLPPGTVKSRIFYAKRALREIAAEQDDEQVA